MHFSYVKVMGEMTIDKLIDKNVKGKGKSRFRNQF